MGITHRAGDLWDIQLPNQIIVHLVNARGTWGAGFAKQLKDSSPRAFNDYKGWCENKQRIPGEFCYFEPNKILSICTVIDYEAAKETTEVILRALAVGLKSFHREYGQDQVLNFISPEIGAGLFGIPWASTQAILEKFLSKNKHKWTVVHKEKP